MVLSTLVFHMFSSISLINLRIGLTPDSAIPSPVLIIIVLPYLCFTGHQPGFSTRHGALCKPIWCCFPTRVLPGPFLKATTVLLDFPPPPALLIQVHLCSRPFPVLPVDCLPMEFIIVIAVSPGSPAETSVAVCKVLYKQIEHIQAKDIGVGCVRCVCGEFERSKKGTEKGSGLYCFPEHTPIKGSLSPFTRRPG